MHVLEKKAESELKIHFKKKKLEQNKIKGRRK